MKKGCRRDILVYPGGRFLRMKDTVLIFIPGGLAGQPNRHGEMEGSKILILTLASFMALRYNTHHNQQ